MNEFAEYSARHLDAKERPEAAFDAEAFLSEVFGWHQAGNLEAAARGYRMILAWQPDFIYALHLLGDAAARHGQVDQGLTAVLRAKRLHPALAGLDDNLMNVADLVFQRCHELRAEQRFDAASVLLQKLHRALPDHELIASQAADTLIRLGRNGEAAAHCRGFLARHPTCDPILRRLAEARMPGQDYYAALDLFHRWLQPAGYLEVGIFTGRSLALASPKTRAVGIDPEPAIADERLANGARLLRMTSDAFFAERDVAAELDGRPLDLAFIDGLHAFEQVLRDFMNIEARAHRRTVVLIHDAVPLNEASSARERTTNIWTGDVWRTILLLRRERPDLTLFTLPAYPSGLCVITNLTPPSQHLHERYDALVAEGMGMGFDALGDDPDDRLAVRHLDWPATVAAIQDAWAGHA